MEIGVGKMNKVKRARKDSIAEKSKNFVEANKVVEPPPHVQLREQDYPFWHAIIRARAQWTDVDLVHAANLARCQADIEEAQRALDREGQVLMNAKGTPIMNPRFTILEQLSRRAVSISSKIQVHAAATIGESKLNRGKNNDRRAAQKAAEKMEDDDLIARPKD